MSFISACNLDFHMKIPSAPLPQVTIQRNDQTRVHSAEVVVCREGSWARCKTGFVQVIENLESQIKYFQFWKNAIRKRKKSRTCFPAKKIIPYM